MSLLRVALRLILGVNICFYHASRWTRTVGGASRSRPPVPRGEFLENDTTPTLRRPDRLQSALTLAAILIAEHATLAQAIAAQPVRAKQPRKVFIDGLDGSLILDRLQISRYISSTGLDLCPDYTHRNFTIPYSQKLELFEFNKDAGFKRRSTRLA
jgi:hypothetical protein